MKRLLASVVLLALAGAALAQTGPSRSTPCSPTTAWNAVCISLTPPTAYTDGVPFEAGTTLTYRVENRVGASGTWATVPHTGTGSNLLVSGLASGSHYFRVYVNASNATAESGASNVADKGVTTGVPRPPVITIAVLVQPGNQPLVLELTAKRSGAYDCKVRVAPKELRTRATCQASAG